MSKKKSAAAYSTGYAQSPSSMGGYFTNEDMQKLLNNTSDEELGRMYRQRKEAQEFLQARGLY